MAIDVPKLVDDVLDALRGELGEGFASIADFAEKQSKMLAQQAAFITEARLNGSLKDDDELFDFFVDQLKEMSGNFARAVAQLTVLTIERAWNAVVDAVWGAINGAIGAAGFPALPIPRAPGAGG
jgi:hypothetical protein